MAVEQISTFSGGMVDRFSSDQIADHQASYLENFEYRDNILRTRRGSDLLVEGANDEGYHGASVVSAGFNTDIDDAVLVARGNNIYRYTPPQQFVKLTLSGTGSIKDTDSVFFIQGINYVYIFRGEGERPWRWDRKFGSAVEDVPNPSVGTVMPAARGGIFAYNRFWLIDGVDTLNISDNLSEAFDLNLRSFKLTQGDGQKLTQVIAFGQGQIIAFKERSIAVIGNANSEFLGSLTSLGLTLEFIDHSFGCGAPDTVVNVGNDVWFLSTAKRGVMSIGQTQFQKLNLLEVPISEPIQKLFNRINWNAADKSSAIHFDNYYLLAVPLDHSSFPNAIIAYDLILKSWIGLWTFRDSIGRLYKHDTFPWYEAAANRTTRTFPVFSIMKLDLLKQGTDVIPIAIGYEGEIVRLLTNSQKDFSGNGEFYLTLDRSNTDYLDFDSIPANLYNQTTGMVEIKFRAREVDNGHTFFEIYPNSSNQVRFDIGESGIISAQANVSGAQWQLDLDDAIEWGKIYTVTLVQDGTEPVILLDGKKVSQTFSVSNDKTIWYSDLPATVDNLRVGYRALTTPPHTFNGDLFYIYFMNWTNATPASSGRGSIVCGLPLNEGSGKTLTTIGSDAVTVSFNGQPSWSPDSTNLDRANFMEFYPATPDQFSSTTVFSETSLGSQTKGIIEWLWRSPDVGSKNVYFLFFDRVSGGSEQLGFRINSSGVLVLFYQNTSGTIQWNINSSSTTFAADTWYKIRVTQDGTAPTVTVNGVTETITFTTSTDKTFWFGTSGEALDRLDIGCQATGDGEVDIQYVHIMNLDESTVAFIDLDSLSFTAENDADITFTEAGSPIVGVRNVESYIHSKLTPRAIGRGEHVTDDMINGVIMLYHRDPKWSLKLITSSYEEISAFTNKTYDQTKYDIAGQTDWVTSNSGDNHDNRHRQNYAPLKIPDSNGITMPHAGIKMNREVLRRETFGAMISDKYFDVEFENTQGDIGIKSIIFDTVQKRSEQLRSS